MMRAAAIAVVMLALCASGAAAQSAMAVSASATLESRPSGSLSPLQSRIDTAPPGATIVVEGGEYRGDLYVDRSITLIGRSRPRLVGSGAGSVVMIRAAGVTIEGFDIDGAGGGDLGRDSSGIHIAAPRATVRDCRVADTLFGIYVREAPGSRIERCRIRGIAAKAAGEKGSGIHVWNTDGFELRDNDIADVRDGIYIQSSPHGNIRGNTARDLRYGLHYMYSDDNVFEDNVFERGAAGTAIMYSRRLTFRRNQFLHNRGFASVGLLLNTCDDVLAEHNLIADNARGVFLAGALRNRIEENVIAGSDVAMVLFDSASESRVTGNLFLGNLAPLSLVGRRTDTVFHGNYWSDNDALDLDGDGRTDQPYRLSSLFDHLRGNLTAADLFSRSLSASALAIAERTFPVLDAVDVYDDAPLAKPPALPVPAARAELPRRAPPAAMIASAAVSGAGVGLLVAGGRRGRRSWGRG